MKFPCPKEGRVGLLIAAVGMAVVAAVFRIPSCDESFWLDELHSAWAVQDGFAKVAERAARGNQTTGYFHFLWCWKQWIGTSELAMRASSVLFSSLAVFFLVIGVGSQTGRVASGVIAGGVLAMDPNGVFFGCELRPYAMVMLLSVLATWFAMVWLEGDDSTRSLGGARWRLAMLFWICVAALVHPTSLGVLGLLVPLAVVVAWRRKRLTLWRADVIAGCVVVATLYFLAASSLPDSWANRDQWKAFGSATDPWQLWYAWSWVPIVVVPASIGIATAAINRNAETPQSWTGWLPMMVGVTATVMFFAASYFDVVPLWHRRYYVAALPMLAWSAGVASTFRLPASRSGQVVALLAIVSVLGCLIWYQGTADTLLRGRIPRQYRGEPWRDAVALLNERREPGEPVWLDSGLIESGVLRSPPDRAEQEPDWEYLSFPVRGPYAVESPTVFSTAEHVAWTQARADDLPANTQLWIFARAGRRSLDRFLARIEPLKRGSPEIRQFGPLWLVRFELAR